MVLPKSSRKGKKAWRRNIDASQELEVLAKASEEARQGNAVAHLEDEQLFFVDKVGAATAALPVAAEDAAAPRKSRPRALPPKALTKAQAILQGAHRGIPAYKPIVKKRKGTGGAKKDVGKAVVAQGPIQGGKVLCSGTDEATDSEAGEECKLDVVPEGDVWQETESASQAWLAVPASSIPAASLRKRRKVVKALAGAPVPAVEVDLPGCSYNPEEEAHQDALARAVAAEVAKEYDADLQAKAPAKTVDYPVETDELALLLVDDDADEEHSDEAAAEDRAQGDASEPGQDSDEGALAAAAARSAAEVQRKTRKDLNRAKRRRAQEEEEAKRKALKQQRRALEQLPALQQELEEELADKARRRARRVADRAERRKEAPPRLGPVPFKPEPLQVLLTEEVSGSLRAVKATPTVLRDRYKSLQKRGIVEPRAVQHVKPGKRVEYVHGSRADGAAERQKELHDTRHALKKVARALKAG